MIAFLGLNQIGFQVHAENQKFFLDQQLDLQPIFHKD